MELWLLREMYCYAKFNFVLLIHLWLDFWILIFSCVGGRNIKEELNGINSLLESLHIYKKSVFITSTLDFIIRFPNFIISCHNLQALEPDLQSLSFKTVRSTLCTSLRRLPTFANIKLLLRSNLFVLVKNVKKGQIK